MDSGNGNSLIVPTQPRPAPRLILNRVDAKKSRLEYERQQNAKLRTFLLPLYSIRDVDAMQTFCIAHDCTLDIVISSEYIGIAIKRKGTDQFVAASEYPQKREQGAIADATQITTEQ